MTVLSFILMMLIPAGITIYTWNFGRWMNAKGYRSGAIGAYLLAMLAFFLAFLAASRSIP